MQYDVVIVGGGLAGLISALELKRGGLQVLVIEKKHYPFHRVCGEYISNEVVPYLHSLGVYPSHLEPAQIQQFLLSSVNGRSITMPLDLGGFGVSRYALDDFLYQQAMATGVEFVLGSQVMHATLIDGLTMVIETDRGEEYQSALVVGAFGKRSRLDKSLDRKFIEQRSDYLGVKYHLKTDFPSDMIALHNFAGGYCGLSRVEGDVYNMCYLGSRKHLRQFGSIPEMEAAVVQQNPFLREVFENSDFLFEKPVVINEISFTPKEPVYQHVLMAGDSAGLITPLCGNGMALAIHAAKLLSGLILQHYSPGNSWDRAALESAYAHTWQRHFARRLWAGRKIQGLFGGVWASNMAVSMGKGMPAVARLLMKQTHGKAF